MASMNSMHIRDLIRSVRQCRNAREEQALISKRCASIRNRYQEAPPLMRNRYMLMLLYIHMLGYPTEFGQIEVVNLIAQREFSGKRIGYLALQTMLDEKDEVMTLAVNHMKSDMTSDAPSVQAIALNAAANVASEEMAHDVFDNVIRLISVRDVYVRRKALLAALRVVRKVPEHAEFFLEKLTTIFRETNSSALLCGLTLVNECLAGPHGATFLAEYAKLAGAAARFLRNLVLSPLITELDVGGVTDPFLQVRILQFMRLVATDNPAAAEELQDVLTQVITNTDASRNVGCAVLYECVRTIDAIECDAELRALAVNTISRFLASTRDNNLRFVALQTLAHYAREDMALVQEQQTVVLECLKDVDVSIRRRALELTVTLINDENVRLLVPDLLAYLDLCNVELRGEVVRHICRVLEDKSPSEEWRVECSLRLLKVARQDISLPFATHLLAVISRQPEEVQARAVLSLWEEASFPFDALHQSRRAFLLVALWCIGEYAEYLVQPSRAKPITAEEVVRCVSEITTNTNYSLIKQYGLTSLMKLVARFPEVRAAAVCTIGNSTTSIDCEVQQRACEYMALLKHFPEEAAFSFSRMPPVQSHDEAETTARPPPPATAARSVAARVDDMTAATSTAHTAVVTSSAAILDDLFGPSTTESHTVPAATASAAGFDLAPPATTHRDVNAFWQTLS